MRRASNSENRLTRVEAQQRADRIRAFQAELEQLEREHVLALDNNQREQLIRYHDETLKELAQLFDVDTTVTQKQMSWGMRIVSFLGALALAASVFLFFYRIWGLISTPLQLFLLISGPILGVLGMEFTARREKNPYFTALIGWVAFACFVLNIFVLGTIFNITPSHNAFIAWGAFAVVLAYSYGLRMLLQAGVICLIVFTSASVAVWSGSYWTSFANRPENFIPMGVFLFVLPAFVTHTKHPDFPAYYRLLGTLTILLVVLSLSHWGEGSYLMVKAKSVEVFYQILGFVLAGLTIWAGIRWHWPEITNLGSTFFVIQLYFKFYDWWWEWMPKYLFFLILGLVAVALLFLFKRLRSRSGQVPA